MTDLGCSVNHLKTLDITVSTKICVFKMTQPGSTPPLGVPMPPVSLSCTLAPLFPTAVKISFLQEPSEKHHKCRDLFQITNLMHNSFIL